MSDPKALGCTVGYRQLLMTGGGCIGIEDHAAPEAGSASIELELPRGFAKICAESGLPPRYKKYRGATKPIEMRGRPMFGAFVLSGFQICFAQPSSSIVVPTIPAGQNAPARLLLYFAN